MMRPRLRCGLVGLAMASPLGCEAVPTLVFSDADAADVGTVDANDRSTDGASGVQDGSFEAGCPAHPPAGTSACCGVVPCNGDCDGGCSQCESKCQQQGMKGFICCARNSVTCHLPGFVCN